MFGFACGHQVILLLAELGVTVSEVAAIARESGETVRGRAQRARETETFEFPPDGVDREVLEAGALQLDGVGA